MWTYGLLLLLAGGGILLHECGHVVGCLLTRRGVQSIRIGAGPLLLELWLAGVAIEIRCAPVSGVVLHHNRQLRPATTWSARRLLVANLIVAAGGPAGTVLMICLICHPTALGLKHQIAVWAALSQALTLCWNLYPRDIANTLGGRLMIMPKHARNLDITRHEDDARAEQHR